MGFGDAEIGQQEGDGFAAHGGPAVGVDGELVLGNRVLFAGFFDKCFGQFGAFARGDHPADDVAAEDIEDDV